MKKGFTILELILVVIIISVLLSIGTISFSYWESKIRTKNFVFELVSEINYARDLARKEGKRVFIVIVKPGVGNQNWIGNSNIDPVCYFIFEDDNKNGNYDNGEKVISYNKCRNVEVIQNGLMRDYSQNGKCMVIFPVGLPLVGASDKFIVIAAKSNHNIQYTIRIHSITGIGEITQ